MSYNYSLILTFEFHSTNKRKASKRFGCKSMKNAFFKYLIISQKSHEQKIDRFYEGNPIKKSFVLKRLN